MRDGDESTAASRDTASEPGPRSPFDERTETGRALATVDWPATALGAWQDWPASLTTAVRMMLGSRFAVCMMYGPESVFLCNDAYRIDSLGDKFPWALGRPMATVWPEVWDVAADRIRSVMAGEATWDEGLQLFLERSGYREETFHTFSYSPLFDDHGATAGAFVIVSETTKQVLADRRLALLGEVGAAVAAGVTPDAVALAAHSRLSRDAPDVPFAVGYLLDTGESGGTSETQPTATLHWAAGTHAGEIAAPTSLTANDSHPWAGAMFTAPATGQTVALDPRRAWPTGPWDVPPSLARVLPLRHVTQGAPFGYIVVGLNPYRAFDAEYARFVELLADQLAAALTRADAFEQERDRHAQQAELDLAKITFFTNVSHELRTPLTLLLGPAEDALADLAHPLGERQRERVALINRNAARLLKLVNTLLDFSRLESGRLGALYEPLDLHRFTAELAAMFDSAMTRAGLDLVVDCDPLPQRPYLDREMWAKIVLNLVSNALKATFEGSVSVRLTDDPQPADPSVGGARLEVADTGIGIAAVELGRLFERFHRVSGARQRTHEGSGIGLALVAELTRLHGGEIDVRSEPGQGSCFTVRIPYGRDHLPAEHVSDTTADDLPDVAGMSAAYVAESLRWSADDTSDGGWDETADPVAGARARVLVVDDSADVRDYVSGLLAADYSVRTARDGAEALEVARTNPPDLVLTDVMMPVLDGFGLLAALREDERTAHLPVIMLSARSGGDAAIEGLEAGADDYLSKPFAARELLARVRANLELDRVRQLLQRLERSSAMLDNAERLARLGSWEVDLKQGTLLISPQLARTSGMPYGGNPIRFDDAMSMAAPEDEERLRTAIAAAVDEGTDTDLEIWAIRTSGERFRARVRASVVADDSGTARYLRGSTQDVTEQRAAEAEIAAAHALREVAAREHEIAAQLQASLLPEREFDAAQLEIAAFYRAGVEGTQVGGDWYDVIDLGLGRTALVVGDVMGRGVQAAAVMGQLRAAIRAYARLSLDPAELVRLLDGTVREVGGDTIVTCIYAVHDAANHTLEYANAGHVPALLRRPDGSVLRLAAAAPPLGAGRHGGVAETVDFAAGDVLTLYTDGLVEQRVGDDLDSRIDLLAGQLESAPAALAGVPDHIVSGMLGAAEATDDVALLVCRGGPRTADEHDARLRVGDGERAVGEARHFVLDTVHGWGARGDSDYDIELAVSELVTNGITHGSRPVELHLHLGQGRLRLSVRDSGDGNPVVRRSRPDEAHGRGLLIVATLSQAWGIEGGTSGKTVWCEFEVGTDPAACADHAAADALAG